MELLLVRRQGGFNISETADTGIFMNNSQNSTEKTKKTSSEQQFCRQKCLKGIVHEIFFKFDIISLTPKVAAPECFHWKDNPHG